MKVKLLAFVVLLTITASSGYTPIQGVELGDTIKADYIVRKTDNSIIEYQEGAILEISYNSLIPGFIDGVLKMKVGERKTFTVPPEQGYESGKLAGMTLIFEVFLVDILKPLQTTSASSETTSSVETTTVSVVEPIGDSWGMLVSFLAVSFSGILITVRKRYY